MSGTPTSPLSPLTLKHLPKRLYATAALARPAPASSHVPYRRNSYSHHSPHPPPTHPHHPSHHPGRTQASRGNGQRYLYTAPSPSALPSGSNGSGFFDSGPPPPTRPAYVRIARGELESGGSSGSGSSGTSGTSHGHGNGGNSGEGGGHGSSTHPSLAFTASPSSQPQPPSSSGSSGSPNSSASPWAAASHSVHYTAPPSSQSQESLDETGKIHRRHRRSGNVGQRYTLDVGAYGIPKRHHHSSSRHRSSSSYAYPTSHFGSGGLRHFHTPTGSLGAGIDGVDGELLSVQVGEDAYFIRSNALGVADGVGGWEARSRQRSGGTASPSPASSSSGPTPSALFASRLMHFCADEIEEATNSVLPLPFEEPPPPQLNSLSPHEGSTSAHKSPLFPPASTSTAPSSTSHPASAASPLDVPRPKTTAPLETSSPSSSCSKQIPTPVQQPWYWTDTHHLAPGPSSWARESPLYSHTLSSSAPTLATLDSAYQPFDAPLAPTFHHDATLSSSVSEPPASPRLLAEESEDEFDLDLELTEEERIEIETALALEHELDELSEGLDVLQILERAYDRTVRAHVAPPGAPAQMAGQESALGPLASYSISNTPSPSPPVIKQKTEEEKGQEQFWLALSSIFSSNSSRPKSTISQAKQQQQSVLTGEGSMEGTPLMVGSSTALLAVLDHVPRPRKATQTTSESSAHESSVETSAFSAEFASSKTVATASDEAATSQTERAEPAEGVQDTELEYDAVLKIAHVGDCMGMLVRGEEIVWRSEEMWWSFNTPVQLGPSRATGTTPQSAARTFSLPIQADDILVLATDGLSDNLWDEEILDEVVRFRRRYLPASSSASTKSSSDTSSDAGASAYPSPPPSISSSPKRDSGYSSPISHIDGKGVDLHTQDGVLWRRTLAGMLSEALCSRARSRATARQGRKRSSSNASAASSTSSVESTQSEPAEVSREETKAADIAERDEDEIPFARRARENGRSFPKGGGKNDDISVVVAVISPVVPVPAQGEMKAQAKVAAVDISKSGVLSALAQSSNLASF